MDYKKTFIRIYNVDGVFEIVEFDFDYVKVRNHTVGNAYDFYRDGKLVCGIMASPNTRIKCYNKEYSPENEIVFVKYTLSEVK